MCSHPVLDAKTQSAHVVHDKDTKKKKNAYLCMDIIGVVRLDTSTIIHYIIQ